MSMFGRLGLAYREGVARVEEEEAAAEPMSKGLVCVCCVSE